MRILPTLAACLLAVISTGSVAAEAAAPAMTPHIVFVREYISELAELERLRLRVESVMNEPEANHMVEMIGYSTRVQIAMRSYVNHLNAMQLEPPHDKLLANIVSLHNSKYRVHGRINEISTAMLSGSKPGVNLDAMAAEMPELRALLDEVDGLFSNMSVLTFTTLLSGSPESASSRLRITSAERDGLLQSLNGEFGEALNASKPSPLANAALVLRNYLQKDFTPSDN
jgi:hypothetical protein